MDKLLKCQEDLHKTTQCLYELENQLEIKKQEVLYQESYNPMTGLLNNYALTKALKSF